MQLEEDEALLTPVVFCQPSGLEFRQPVTLTLPHCASQLQENWRVNILSSQTDVESADTEWRALQIGEYESRSFSMLLYIYLFFVFLVKIVTPTRNGRHH